jgi:hypothetical protein
MNNTYVKVEFSEDVESASSGGALEKGDFVVDISFGSASLESWSLVQESASVYYIQLVLSGETDGGEILSVNLISDWVCIPVGSNSAVLMHDPATTFSLESTSAPPTFDFSLDLLPGLTMSWTVEDEVVRFEVVTDTDGWFAIGFNKDCTNCMIGTDVIMALPGASGNDQVREYKINGKSGSQIVPDSSQNLAQVSLSPISSSSSNSRRLSSSGYKLRFTRQLQPDDPTDFSIDPSAGTTIVFARGSATSSVSYHDPEDRGASVVELGTGLESKVAVNPLKIVHGVLMGLSWGFLLPLGVILARFFKHKPDAWWFRMHVICQRSGVVLMLVGVIIAFIMVEGSHFNGFHTIIGLIVFILGVLQPINAALRPHPGPTATRRRWEWLHKGSGYIAVLGGFTAVITGSAIIDPGNYIGVVITVIVTVGFVITFVALSLRKTYPTKSVQSDIGMDVVATAQVENPVCVR